MGQVRKIGNEYYIEFYARGLLYQQKAGPDYEYAQKLLQDIEEKITQGEMGTIVRDIEIDIFLKTFLEYARQQHTENTYKRYQSLAQHFGGFLKTQLPHVKKLSEVTPSVIECYRLYLIQSNGRKINRINFTLVLLRDLLDFAIKLGYLNDNPGLHARFVDDPSSRPVVFLTAHDEEKILSAASSMFKDITVLLLETGMSLDECLAIKSNDVDFKNHRLAVKTRVIPLTEKAEKILGLKFSEKNKLSKEELIKELENLRQTLCLSDKVNFATFRHTFVRNLFLKGVSLVKIYQILGFKDIARVAFYLPLLEERKLI